MPPLSAKKNSSMEAGGCAIRPRIHADTIGIKLALTTVVCEFHQGHTPELIDRTA
jgi:hypothetical protein